jgi:hypothetical protein
MTMLAWRAVSISSTQQTRHMTVTCTPVPFPGAGGSMDTQNGHPFRHHIPPLLTAWPIKYAGTMIQSLLSPPNHHQPTIREACRLHSRGSQRYLVGTAALLGVPNTHPQHAIGLGRTLHQHTKAGMQTRRLVEMHSGWRVSHSPVTAATLLHCMLSTHAWPCH